MVFTLDTEDQEYHTCHVCGLVLNPGDEGYIHLYHNEKGLVRDVVVYCPECHRLEEELDGE